MSQETYDEKPFGFEVETLTASGMSYDGWTQIHLPHSCDEWVIALVETRTEAKAELRRFIDEAQALLDRL